MTIYTATRGEVVGAPVRISTATAEGGWATALLLREFHTGDSGASAGPGRRVGPGEYVGPDVEYQVCFREPDLGRQVLQRVRVGDRLVVLGTLHLQVVAGPVEDPVSAARVSLEAIAVGLDLSPGPQ